ncbi:MAG: metal ABC transporter permease [Hyphomicrobiales bacterium]|nr:metal ABC transporter permease [Hyphomicrobiales bacterium]
MRSAFTATGTTTPTPSQAMCASTTGGAMLDDFFTRAILGGVGVAALAAPLGCFVVWRRMAYFGETIAYSGLLGVALGFILGVDPTVGVFAVCIVIALTLAGLQGQTILPEDTLLGILAHVGLAGGLILATLTGGARLDLMGYLFGDILAISTVDVALIWLGAATVYGALVGLWRPLLALSVHEELAAAEGVNVRLVRVAYILLIALAVALAMKVVGILLITSLLIFPAAAARSFARTPEAMAAGAVALGAAGVTGGLYVSLGADAPAGPSIVVTLTALLAASAVWRLVARR